MPFSVGEEKLRRLVAFMGISIRVERDATGQKKNGKSSFERSSGIVASHYTEATALVKSKKTGKGPGGGLVGFSRHNLLVANKELGGAGP